MSSVLILGAMLMLTLVGVSLINKAQERRRRQQIQQRSLRRTVVNLEEVLACLEQTVPTRLIAKYVNDEILERLQLILKLETGPTEHLESSLRDVEARGELLAGARQLTVSYQKDSDVQIAQAQHHINEAGRVLRRRFSQGHIPEEELEAYIDELTWAHLMVSVFSLIGQGHKATARGDVFSAQAFYQKAQHFLMGSLHPDPKRMRMIKELGEVIAGNRQTLSLDLMPADPPRP